MATDAAGPRRRLDELLIAVAAAALGCSMARYHLNTPSGISIIPRGDDAVVSLVGRQRAGGTELRLVLACLTLAYAAIGLRRRPLPLGSYLTRPGIVASVVAIATLGVSLAIQGTRVAIEGWPTVQIPFATSSRSGSIALDAFGILVLPRIGLYVGPAIVAAWVLVLASGRWKRPADVTDLLGQAIGAAWIANGIAML